MPAAASHLPTKTKAKTKTKIQEETMDLNDLWTFITDHQGAAWMSLALLLLAGEMLLPGVYLLWLGVAALLAPSPVGWSAASGFARHAASATIFPTTDRFVANLRTILAFRERCLSGKFNQKL